MSEGVHAVQHEVEHRIGHDENGAGHGAISAPSRNRKIALLIAVLALFLALSETLGKSAQTAGLELNIKASDTWNFFQAKTVRQTTLRTAAEAFAIELIGRSDDANKAAMSKQVEAWNATVKRYDSDPKEKDGRKELKAQAEQYEHERDTAFVLASAAVITGMIGLAYGAAGVGVVGLIFTGIGLFAPQVPHELMHLLPHGLQAAGAH